MAKNPVRNSAPSPSVTCFKGLALLAALTVSLGLAPVRDSWRTGFERIREADLRAGLELIASDAMLGRMSLEPGDDAAAQWVVAEFKKAGLQPAASGDFLQAVPLIEYRPNAAARFNAGSRPM